MKKSNITLIATSAIILIIIVLSIVQARKTALSGIDNKSERFETIELKEFSVLVAEKNSNVSFTQSDTFRIEVSLQEEEKLEDNFYKIISDTLFVYTEKPVSISGRNIKSVICNHAKVFNFGELTSDTLSITSNGTETVIRGANSNIKLLNVLTKGTEMFLYTCQAENLTAYSDSSEITITDGKYKNLQVNMKNRSSLKVLDITSIEKMNLERDELSRIYLNVNETEN